MKWIGVFLLPFVWVFCRPDARAQEPKGVQLLEWVSGAQRAAREAVRTLHCRVEYSLDPGEAPNKVQPSSSECWYSPDAIRIKSSGANVKQDYLWKQGTRTTIVTNTESGQPRIGVHRATFPDMHFNPTEDPFVVGLLVLNLPGTVDCVTLETMIKNASRIGRVEKKTGAESNLVFAQLFFDKSGELPEPWEVHVFLDARANYLVRKVVYIATRRSQEEVLSFKEFGPGVFFPAQVSFRSEVDGRPAITGMGTLSDVEVNKPLPPDVFALRFPAGIVLTDRTAGVSYKIDADGKRISAETPLPTGSPPPSVPDGVIPVAGKETNEEPGSLTRWLLPASLCFIMAGVFAGVYRWWKRREAALR